MTPRAKRKGPRTLAGIRGGVAGCNEILPHAPTEINHTFTATRPGFQPEKIRATSQGVAAVRAAKRFGGVLAQRDGASCTAWEPERGDGPTWATFEVEVHPAAVKGGTV